MAKATRAPCLPVEEKEFCSRSPEFYDRAQIQDYTISVSLVHLCRYSRFPPAEYPAFCLCQVLREHPALWSTLLCGAPCSVEHPAMWP